MNVVFILMDDMGWRDLSCYGSDFYETPNIDRLARESMTFTNAYASCPVCSPTRASVMTGKYPARLGITDWIDNSKPAGHTRGRVIDAPYKKELSYDDLTIAQAFKAAGYRTWHVGKWHLGGDERHWPLQHGFDVNFGGCHMGMPWHGYYAPWKIPTLSESTDGTYLTDRLTDEAVKLISESDGTPFFMYFAHYAVHTPIQAKKEYVPYFEDKARRLLRDKVNPLIQGEVFPCEHKKTQRVTRRVIQSDAAYAAMIRSVDESVGRVVAALKEKGVYEDTVIVFTSDNGGLSTAEGSPTTNAPLAEGKGWMYDGGVREPLIFRAPGATRPGSVCEEPTTTPDFYPTLLQLCGLSLRPQQHMDGVSILPLLREEPFARGPLFWHYPHYGNQGGTPGCSVREGDYKLIQFFEDGHIELYNLREDISETCDLAQARPDIAARLLARLQAWQNDVCAVFPERNDGYQP